MSKISRPSLVAITSQLPWPIDRGGHIRTFHLLRGLARRFDVLLCTRIEPGEEDGVRALAECGIEVHPAVARMRPQKSVHERLRALWCALRGEPYVMFARHRCRRLEAVIREQLARKRPDVLYLDHLDPLVFRRNFPSCPVVMDMHNVYSRIGYRAAGEAGSWVLRAYLKREARLLEHVEQLAARVADRLFVVSADEAECFRELGGKAVQLVPNGVDCEQFRPRDPNTSREPIMLFVGSMDWEPNIMATEFLAKQVLPVVRANCPNVRLQIVGRNPAPRVRALGELPCVQVTGGVRDVVPYMHHAAVLAVPLETGGGTRLKILEAFAAQLPVVSTPVGCEGIAAENQQHLLVADRDAFAAAVVELLTDQQLALKLAGRASALAMQKYDWNSISEHASASVCDMLG